MADVPVAIFVSLRPDETPMPERVAEYLAATTLHSAPLSGGAAATKDFNDLETMIEPTFDERDIAHEGTATSPSSK